MNNKNPSHLSEYDDINSEEEARLLRELDSETEVESVKFKVGKDEVMKMFVVKAVNAYHMMKRMYGNPKFKQVIASSKRFRDLSTMAKRYLCKMLQEVKLK
jgi:hypothetical protein